MCPQLPPPPNLVPASALLLVEPLRPQAARISEVSRIGCLLWSARPQPPGWLCTCMSPAPPPVRVPEAEPPQQVRWCCVHGHSSRSQPPSSLCCPRGWWPSSPCPGWSPGQPQALLYQVRVLTQLLRPECLPTVPVRAGHPVLAGEACQARGCTLPSIPGAESCQESALVPAMCRPTATGEPGLRQRARSGPPVWEDVAPGADLLSSGPEAGAVGGCQGL